SLFPNALRVFCGAATVRERRHNRGKSRDDPAPAAVKIVSSRGTRSLNCNDSLRLFLRGREQIQATRAEVMIEQIDLSIFLQPCEQLATLFLPDLSQIVRIVLAA